VWHNAWELENIVSKFCKPIFALTGDAQFPYCLMGSGATVKMAGRHFLFCCQHQIRDYTPDKIAIPLSFEAKIMSAASMRRLAITEANRDDDTIDVAAFEFDVDAYGVPNLTSEFFPPRTHGFGQTDRRGCRSWFSAIRPSASFSMSSISARGASGYRQPMTAEPLRRTCNA
jgi:hypothetical protein